MSQARDLSRLTDVAQLMLDHRLGALRAAAAGLEQSRAQLEAINAAAAPADLPPLTAETVARTYERWADVRRSELNLVIARQTAEMLEARDAAGTAFGRLQALRRVAERLAGKG
jgi:hypothetical protein